MTAVFAQVSNPTGADITIVGAATSAGQTAELHEVVMSEGSMVMRPKPGGFVVPAGESLLLEPGGNHIMVMGMKAPIMPGQNVNVTLALSDGSTLGFAAIAKDYSGGGETYSP